MIVKLLLSVVFGALIYRLRGRGTWPSRPWWQILFALPYAEIPLALGASSTMSVLVFLATSAATLTGHASYIDLGSVKPGQPGPRDGQTEEWYGSWLPGNPYWHDFLGVALSGLLITLASGIAIVCAGYVWTGLGVAASGLLKALAYAAAWKSKELHLTNSDPIAVAEVLAGGLLWGSLAAIAMPVL